MFQLNNYCFCFSLIVFVCLFVCCELILTLLLTLECGQHLLEEPESPSHLAFLPSMVPLAKDLAQRLKLMMVQDPLTDSFGQLYTYTSVFKYVCSLGVLHPRFPPPPSPSPLGTVQNNTFVSVLFLKQYCVYLHTVHVAHIKKKMHTYIVCMIKNMLIGN